MNQWSNAGNNTSTTMAGESVMVDALFKKGRRYHSDGNYSDALQTYKKALVNDRGNSRIWLNMGLAYSAQGKNEDALRAYFIACKLDPTLYGSRRARENIGEIEEKVKHTLNTTASPHRYRILLREFEDLLGIQDKAIPIITRIHREDDGELIPDQIEEEFPGIVEGMPGTRAQANDLIAIELGNIRNIEDPWSDQFDNVIAHYRNIFRTIEQRPFVPYYYQTEEHEEWIGSVKQEIDENLEIYEEQPPHFEKENKQQLISEIALSLSRILDFERAIDVCQRSYAINPHYPRTRMIHGHCNSYVGRFEDAKDQYERALDKSEDMDERCEILELKGVAHFRLDEVVEAIESFRTALRISKKLRRSGKMRDATKCYERSLKNVENLAFMGDIMYLKGMAHLLEKEKDRAKECFGKAMDMANSVELKEKSTGEYRRLEFGET
jgi:tetratricopeptide (TPR) repeat protein